MPYIHVFPPVYRSTDILFSLADRFIEFAARNVAMAEERVHPCRAGYGSLFWDWNRGCIRMAGRQPRQKVAGNKARRTCHCPPDVRL